ncbi:hypothetical protein DEJ38_06530 [Kocuria rosea]|uniref:glycosyl hydrolase family 28-related protein n=1 Tax=Kocuria rosea TaxID=1275 RepID=UPI000D6576F5|nr:glycosyl hydrolase family 28-related protein [Kocuria rosea]PWF82349.1 hypothetical protein DEJ38_06530 [Kocuria rosea]
MATSIFPNIDETGAFVSQEVWDRITERVSGGDGAQFVRKGDLAVSVRDYGAKGDNLTDDTAALGNAITAAQTAGAQLYWPAGTYLISGNLAGFWSVPHGGEGVIRRDGETHHITPKSSGGTHQRNTLHVNATGSDGNDGLTTGHPLASLTALDNALGTLGARALAGEWRASLSGTFTGGRWFAFGTRFAQPLVISGAPYTGTPTTVIEYSSTTGGAQGFWYEGQSQITVENILFRGFRSNGSGYGAGVKGQCKILIRNCQAENCDIGFAAINQAVATFQGCTATGCDFGFRTQYATSTTWNTCTAAACVTGFYCSRNAIAHLDYSTAEGCTYAGLRTDMASRVIALESHFKRNAVAVMARGVSQWSNANSLFYVGTADANTRLFEHYGAANEEAAIANAATEWRAFGDYTTRFFTGTTANTAVVSDSRASVPALYFGDPRKKVRLRVWGNITGTAGTKTLRFYTANLDGSGVAVIPGVVFEATYAGRYVFEVELVAQSLTSQTLLVRADRNGVTPYLSTGTTGHDFTNGKRFVPYVLTAAAADAIAVEGFEVFFTG